MDSGEIKWQKEFPHVFAGLDDVPAASAEGIIVTTALQGDFVKNNKSGAQMIHNDHIYVGSPITKKCTPMI